MQISVIGEAIRDVKAKKDHKDVVELLYQHKGHWNYA